MCALFVCWAKWVGLKLFAQILQIPIVHILQFLEVIIQGQNR